MIHIAASLLICGLLTGGLVAAASGAEEGGPEFSDLARELADYKGVVVGVMRDRRFEGREVPATLRYEDFAKTWGTIPGVRVVPLDADQIRSYSILFRGKMDILVYPYGSIYPMDAYPFYSGQYFNDFLKRGGAVLTTGGIPFASQADPGGSVIPTRTPAELTEVFDKWISKFGIKYYQCQAPPAYEAADRDLLPEAGSCDSWTPSTTGVIVNNSAHEPAPKPEAGNVFPERTPERTILPLLTGHDQWGRETCVSAVLAQDFVDGSRRIHFTHEGARHPLSPEQPGFAAIMRGLFELLNNRVFVKDVETGYACYRQGEPVTVRAQLVSFEPEASVEAILQIRDAKGALVYREVTPLKIGEHGSANPEWKWTPGKFGSDEYVVQVWLQRGGRIVSKAGNGFVVWNDEVVKKGPKVGIQGDYLTLDGEPTIITGANYYESTRGEAMWYRPDVSNIMRDYRLMHDCGVNMIRPHYHHLKWFHDYLLYNHDRLPDFYSGLNAGVTAMPDERTWRIWDMFIYLGEKYGIVYNGDLFTLVPEEMGDPRGWCGSAEIVYDRSLRPAQKKFLLALDRRYRDAPGITWDLFNEPSASGSALAEWAEDLRSALAADGSHRLLTVGGPGSIGGGVDFYSPHGALSASYRNQTSRPVLSQEFYVDRPEPLASEMEQAEAFRDVTVRTLRGGGAGWMPWSWTRQMRLWQDNYEHHYTFPMEKWDDRLGMNTHDDGTLKPAGIVFKDIAFLVGGIRPVGYDPATCRVTTTSGTLTALTDAETGAGDEIVHAGGEGCLAAMARGTIKVGDAALVEGPAKAYVYLRAEDGGFAHAHEVFVKSEGAGQLKIARGGARSVELVDASPSRCQVLDRVPFSTTPGTTSVEVSPGMTAYWLRLEFDEDSR